MEEKECSTSSPGDSESEIQPVQNEIQTTTVEEFLICCVQNRPALWDSRLPLKERSKSIRDQLWMEIYEEFGSNSEFSLEYLMKKWRTLRDTYVRITNEYTPSGSGASKRRKWEHLDSMSFLSDTIKYKTTISNIDLPTTSRSQSSSSTTPPLLSPTSEQPTRTPSTQPSRTPKGDKVEDAIIGVLSKINCPPPPSETIPKNPLNPICIRISELLEHVPQQERVLLEIKLLQVAYEGAQNYLSPK